MSFHWNGKWNPTLKWLPNWRYLVFVMTMENRHGSANIHGLSDEQLQKMAAKYKVHASAGKKLIG
jgi:hypothetical protein